MAERVGIYARLGRILCKRMEMLNMCEQLRGRNFGSTDIKAAQKLSKIPKHMQARLLSNVFCPECGVTTIVEFSMHNDKFGIALMEKCKNVAKT